ncbi:MAG TPA: capsule assembly Wzi family protein [Gemmatimonadaceae bacterium]
MSLAQRPLSRAAFARIVAEASRRLHSADAGASRAISPQRVAYVDDVLSSLRERLELPDSGSMLPLTTEFAPIRVVTLDQTQTDQPTRLVPPDNGLGGIDATLNTLLELRQGRPLAQGYNGYLETNHTVESHYVAISVTPEILSVRPTEGSESNTLRLQELQGRLLLKNLAIDVGREYVVWGQGRDVGMLNSNNSPPLDLIKLSSEEPFYFPWFLRRLGPTRFSIFYSDLGADQNFPHAYAIGYKGSIAPTSYLELGASVYTKAGGEGAPRATTTARLIDLLPFLDASAYNNILGVRGKFQFSDHYAGLDGRLRIPSLASSFYWELLLNDFDVRRLESVLWEDAGHVFGLDLPALSPSGRLRGSLEYHHTGVRYYEHEQFLSGQTVHHVLTGDPLGPDAQGAYANLDYSESAYSRLGVQFALERRSGDQYVFTPEPHYGFRRVSLSPREWQGRVVGTWQLLPKQNRLGGLAQFGYERTRNFDFLAGDDVNGFMGRIALEYRFK